MNSVSFQDSLSSHATWRKNLCDSLERYHLWRIRNNLSDANSVSALKGIIQNLSADRVTLAFVAEFSRGKTELINSLFFGETGVRLLPSAPGRTTMSPTELFYDENEGSYIRLLEIESRLEDSPMFALKQDKARWQHIKLDPNSPEQMQEAFQQLVAVKEVPKTEAIKLGLYNEKQAVEMGIEKSDVVEIPRWRHALISFPHPLLKEGLTILDTPGLNALGAEPELTLSMLPSAQTIIFVIAADTGVTKSDMEIWQQHINKATKTGKQGLAVVMNKIDTMWDEITTESSYDKSIALQKANAAKFLKLSEDLIFPVSAKQALIAKIKNDQDLLKKSRLAKIENYLSTDIIERRQKILTEVIARDISFLVSESYSLTENNYAKSCKQLEELMQLDFENRDLIAKIIEDTESQQANYFQHLTEFKRSKKEFNVIYRALTSHLSPRRIDMLINLSRDEISKNMTTYGMKQSIHKLFEELRQLLQDCIDNTASAHTLIKDIHKTFHNEYGFQAIEPQLFKIEPYQAALEKLYDEGEAFRQSTRMTLTEQSILVKKLYETLIYKARDILAKAHKEVQTWGRNVMSPLMHQILAYKKQIEDRLKVLSSSIESKQSLKTNLEKMEQDLAIIIQQRTELKEIVMEIEAKTSIFDKNHLIPDSLHI